MKDNPILDMMDEIEKTIPEECLDHPYFKFYIGGARAAAKAFGASQGLSRDEAIKVATVEFSECMMLDSVDLILNKYKED